GPLSDVTGDRVFLFAGTRDVIVSPSIVRAARRFYRRIGVPDAQIVFVDQIKAGHGFVTESEGGICAQSATPYVVDCDYDLAGTLLAHIYGPLAARGKREAGRFIAFDQRHYAGRAQNTGLANEGRAYVPDACATTPGCRIHVAFHGCQQNRSAVGDIFIARSGLAEWAASNRMIVLFPQTKATPGNPQGCWDWWGLTGSNYLTRSAPQIATVRAMLAALARAPAK
ncbi:MAG: poly(3-hydroxybutyrate) depolymerase, partial [Pseudomonadota bacterium]